MNHALDSDSLDLMFREARTHNVWRDESLTAEDLAVIYELAKMGPTSANCCPARFVFITSDEAKARLKPNISSGNVEKVMAAPATVIIAYDLDFPERMPELFPHNPDAKNWFKPILEETAFRNGTLQGAYFMLAARALGYDCGPMSGFDQEGIDKEFFPNGRIRSNFICSIGHGDPSGLHPRGPRLAFDDACSVL